MFSPKALIQFKELYERNYGIELKTDKQVLATAIRVFDLVMLASEPLDEN